MFIYLSQRRLFQGLKPCFAWVLTSGLALCHLALAQDNAAFKPNPSQLASLRIQPVQAHTFRSQVMTDGRVVADDEQTTPLFSPYSGRVIKVVAGLGDAVHKGQVLALVDASEWIQGQNDLMTAVAALAGADAQLQQAKQTEHRRHDLLEAKAGSIQDWQQSLAELAAAEANQKTALAGLTAVRNRLRVLGQTPADLEAIERGEHRDGVAPLLAPIDGVIVGRQLAVGQFIQSGAANPVYVVANLATVWLEAGVRESDAPDVKVGDEAWVELPALPTQVIKGRLSYVAPLIDPDSHRLTVRARVNNSKGQLKPGMLGRFRLVRHDASTAPAVPLSAVIHDGKTERVWVQAADGSLSARTIQAGRADQNLLEVRAGLRIGEKIVTGGALFIDRAAQPD